MKNDTPLTPEELASILRREYDNADNFHDVLEGYQDQAFRYYEAQPFGNEVEGRSQVVLPDVQETVDYMSASVLRTFVSGERTVEFEATDEADELAATEATEAINYVFMRKQDGYRILHDGCVDGLLKKIGVFKTVMETEERVSRQRVTFDPLLMGEIDAEFEQVEENEDGTVTATVKQMRVEKRFRDYAVPTGEFRFTPDARHEDDADYLCHACDKTRSELVEMGFNADQVYSLPTYNTETGDIADTSSALDGYYNEQSTPALERVLLCEEYARIDVDGDGIAERVKVYRVENEILIDAETGELSIETVDEQPFSVFSPFPRPHRLVGYSLADKVMDLQLARSFVARQLFDGLAFANMPRPIVDEQAASKNTYNDLLSPIPGSPIRVKGGAASVQPLQTGFDVGKSLSVLEWITGERESRTGITRMNQGLDADALNKTATGTALMQAAGQQQEEFIARNLAETMSRLFAKKYRLMRSEGEPFRIKVDGQYKMVDPTQWPEDICMVVKVGLGSGSKDRRVQARMALMEPIAMAVQQGLAGPEHVFNWMDGMARDTGVGKGDDFMFDPSSEEGMAKVKEAASKPNPEVQAKQAELQARQMDNEADRQLKAAEAEQKLRLIEREHTLKAELEERKQQRDMELAVYKFDREAELAVMKARLEARAKVDIADQKMGGSVAA